MAIPFVVEVFVISFSNLGNVKSWIIQEIEHRKHALKTKMAKMWISPNDFSRGLPFSNYNMRRKFWTESKLTSNPSSTFCLKGNQSSFFYDDDLFLAPVLLLHLWN